MDRLLGLIGAPLVPAWAVATALHPRWRRDWPERVGLEVPPVQPGALWVHAASVGELAGAEALLEHLRRPVLLTADTDTGAARARALALGRPGVAGGRKPADHPWTLAPVWAEARPRGVVFLEDTWWPTLAARAKRAGVPVIRAATRDPWWGRADLVLPAVVFGDPKGDRPTGPPLLRFARPFAVGASLRPGDTLRFLEVTDALGLQALVAPRHPDRFDPRELGGRHCVRRSALADPDVPTAPDVVLLDTVGELHRCLVGARFVFVGGTFDPAIGGHAPWDAARLGLPIVAGPHVAGQGDAFERVGATVAIDGDLLAAARHAVPSRPPSPVAAELARRIEAACGPPAPESSPRPWASALGPLVALGVPLRRISSRAERLSVPVISVGSTNARSPGRTSTVRALVAVLRAEGHTVGVATRGYRRSRRGRDVRDSVTGEGSADLGDEGALLAEAGALVAAAPDRRAAGRRLVELGATVILLDDGLQTATLVKDLEVVVVDARYPRARGLLPAGERREWAPVPARADLVLVHHGDGRFAFPGEPVTRHFTAWSPGTPTGPVAAVAGIGRGADFLATLDVAVGRVCLLADHEVPDVAALLAWAGELPIVCTAKDRARMPPELRGRVCWRDVALTLPEAVRAAVIAAAAG
ncbi:MAG: tetraacyldisaccharide 4'-kinase [Alphaproteobacteria bacterium]|nr:tetraacyldisaccharide 4'-kinase [Alphaproteobacteria bacterium]